ncbi:response regulator [Chitinimonas lacunae]|uniref:Response regulator n=1 Tax=Chitinimonas lacunae TaxID=1963018 RepID=A0ABV8MTR3_9NEIS
MPTQNVPLTPLVGRRILLVEDARVNQLILTRWLRGWGAEVICADTLAQARSVLCSVPAFDGVLVDRHLPDGYGTELLPQLTHCPHVLAMTMIDQDSDQLDLLAAGFDEVLPKPVDPIRLYAAFSDSDNRGMPSQSS